MANYKPETTRQLGRIRTYFRSQGKLYFKSQEKILIEKGTPEETLDKIIGYIKEGFSTIDSEGIKVTGNAQRRTLKELYRLMYSVHPTLRVSTLIELILAKMKAGFADSIICATIHKRVFYFYKKPWEGRDGVDKVFSGEPIDEFKLDWKDILIKNELDACHKDHNGGTTYASSLGKAHLDMEEYD